MEVKGESNLELQKRMSLGKLSSEVIQIYLRPNSLSGSGDDV